MTEAAGDLDALREHLAAARGLPAGASQFVTGSTLDQIESSASALAELIGSRRVQESEPTDPIAGLFTRSATEKAAHQAAVIQAVHGPQPQARDEQGRYASVSSFDGGARENPPPPPQSHEALVDRRLAQSQGRRRRRGLLSLDLPRAPLRTPPQADNDEHDPKHDQDDPRDHKRPSARRGEREHARRDEDDNGRREERHEAKRDRVGGASV